ncbi:MAG: hypothetical protein ABEJ56_02890 [Candidatus Nanohaloarchaea archaeon]
MSANHRNYEAYLEYFPEKERKALEQAEFVENGIDEAAVDTIKQLNRSKKAESFA